MSCHLSWFQSFDARAKPAATQRAVQGSESGKMHWTWPWPRICSSDKSSKYFRPPTKRLFLVSPPREEWPFTPFSLSRHSLILLHLVSRRGHMSSPDRETRVLGNKQKTERFSTFCLHLLFIWGVLGLNQLTRFISRGINWGSAQQALSSVHHQLSLIWRRGSQDFRYSSKRSRLSSHHWSWSTLTDQK